MATIPADIRDLVLEFVGFDFERAMMAHSISNSLLHCDHGEAMMSISNGTMLALVLTEIRQAHHGASSNIRDFLNFGDKLLRYIRLVLVESQDTDFKFPRGAKINIHFGSSRHVQWPWRSYFCVMKRTIIASVILDLATMLEIPIGYWFYLDPKHIHLDELLLSKEKMQQCIRAFLTKQPFQTVKTSFF